MCHTVDFETMGAADNVLKHLLAAELKPKDLQEALQISPSMASRIMAGERGISTWHLDALSDLLKTSVPELFEDPPARADLAQTKVPGEKYRVDPTHPSESSGVEVIHSDNSGEDATNGRQETTPTAGRPTARAPQSHDFDLRVHQRMLAIAAHDARRVADHLQAVGDVAREARHVADRLQTAVNELAAGPRMRDGAATPRPTGQKPAHGAGRNGTARRGAGGKRS